MPSSSLPDDAHPQYSTSISEIDIQGRKLALVTIDETVDVRKQVRENTITASDDECKAADEAALDMVPAIKLLLKRNLDFISG